MPSLCEIIREFLKPQDSKLDWHAVACGVGMPGDQRVMYALSGMSNGSGMLVKERDGNRNLYGFNRDPRSKPPKMLAKQKVTEYEVKREAERRKVRAERRARKNAAIKAKRTMQRMNTLAAAVGLDKAIDPRPGHVETVAEFLARGGNIQHLEPNETSIPLRFMTDID